MSTSETRRLSWTAQHKADVAAIDQSFADTARKFVKLIDSPLKRSPSIKIKRGGQVDMDSAPFRRRIQIVMHAAPSEVTSASGDLQRLFLDLGMGTGDHLDIEVTAARRDWLADPRIYAKNLYSVTLMPTTYRPDLFGVEFNDAHQLWFLKSGTPVDKTEAPISVTNRYLELEHTFNLMREGTVYDSYSEGTHAAVTIYKHKPHPYLALIHRGAADWVTRLVESRPD